MRKSEKKQKKKIAINRQHGLRPQRETIDTITFNIRLVMQKVHKRGVKLHLNFVDLKNAFDTIWRKALWKMMMSIGINKK